MIETIHEGSNEILERTLKYSQNWSVSAKRGQPVARTDTSAAYFYVKNTISDSSPVISLSDASLTQISWADATNGVIHVHIGRNSAGQVGDNKVYELRVKFSDGTYATAESGTLHIVNSVVDSPA